MKSLRTVLITAALASLAVTATPFTAHAVDSPAAGQTAAVPNPPTGRLHAYYDYWYQNECGSWSGSAASWGECKNNAASLWNLRYPGSLDDVWVYYNSNYGGAGRGVYNGAGLPDLRDWSFGPGGSGAGKSLYHNIASHRVVNLP